MKRLSTNNEDKRIICNMYKMIDDENLCHLSRIKLE